MGFSAKEISQYLADPSLQVEVYDCVSSTNTLAKQRGLDHGPEGLVIAAASQSAGRGRMGRSFFSPDQTGVYFSLLLRPALSPQDSLLITTAAAVACARALERISGRPAAIKWVNDIYMEGRKVCGILAESCFTGGPHADFVVLGIGINLYSPKGGFPTDISLKAGSVLQEQSEDLRSFLVAEVINQFLPLYECIENRAYLEEYRSRSLLTGKPITVIKSAQMLPAIALSIEDDLSLLVRYEDGTTEALSSGDVSIRPI